MSEFVIRCSGPGCRKAFYGPGGEAKVTAVPSARGWLVRVRDAWCPACRVREKVRP